jgi:hypothetical protein
MIKSGALSEEKKRPTLANSIYMYEYEQVQPSNGCRTQRMVLTALSFPHGVRTPALVTRVQPAGRRTIGKGILATYGGTCL